MQPQGGRGARGGQQDNDQAAPVQFRPRVETVPYEERRASAERFLSSFHTDPTSVDGLGDISSIDLASPMYLEMIKQVTRRERVELPLFVDHMDQFFQHDEDGILLVEEVLQNTVRYLELFSEVIDTLIEERFKHLITYSTEDASDVYLMHQMQVKAGQEEQQSTSLPPALRRRYEVCKQLKFVPRAEEPPIALRGIRASHVGKLVKTRGIAIRVSEVMPLVTVVTYVCESCGFENYQPVTTRFFMPEVKCTSRMCSQKKKKSVLHMQPRGSKFIKFQEVRIQELPEEVPVGHIPRSMTMHVVGEQTRSVTPGDVAVVEGIFLPVPVSGYRALRVGLTADTYLYVQRIERRMKTYSEYALTPELLTEVEMISQSPDAYTRLAMSIAPEIFGHLDVKKALLLMMVGGVTKQNGESMRIRGDLNICLMGDPGVAKSQLLRHISTIAPRGIYTSGKGSSGVGLTAAVLRDPITKEFVLEGGSLVLADMGICCIDEFDKMADADRTAIHEVMEQQSISIAKAGITTTLNARTSILAAANPAFGRYNTNKTPWENINLPAALLSRFDLLFLLLDKHNMEKDIALARHITHVHRYEQAPDLQFEPLESDFLRCYISQAKKCEPFVPEHLTEHIVNAYVNMREEEANAQDQAMGYTTARTLLSILRLSQALARIRFAPTVGEADIDEAIRLMNVSKLSLVDDEPHKRKVDTLSATYLIIKDYSASINELTVSYDEVLRRVLRKGYAQSDLNNCLEAYERLNVWIVAPDQSTITFL